MGIPDAVCLDFDFATFAHKRWADNRADATVQVPAPEERNRKPMKTVPKYPTLIAVLGLDEDRKDVPPPAEVEALAEQLMSGTVDWSAYGWDE
jgi:hypothetical protein